MVAPKLSKRPVRPWLYVLLSGVVLCGLLTFRAHTQVPQQIQQQVKDEPALKLPPPKEWRKAAVSGADNRKLQPQASKQTEDLKEAAAETSKPRETPITLAPTSKVTQEVKQVPQQAKTEDATPVKKEAATSFKRTTSVTTTAKPRDPPATSITFAPAANTTGPRIAYLTYSHLNGTSGLSRFEELIFPSLETWHSTINEPYYIVLSAMWKSTYETLITSSRSNFSVYANRMQPIWVDCGEGKQSSVECCKQEQGMLQLLAKGDDYDWIVYLDDDNYIRHRMMIRLLGSVSTDEVLVLTSGPTARSLGIFGYLPQKSPYRCSKDPSFQYPWGQVIAYNHATMKYLKKGLELGGLTKQCKEYRVYHDVGNAIFHWMYQLPELELRIADRPNNYRPENIGSHGVGRCFGLFTCDMFDVVSYYKTVDRNNEDLYDYHWRNATGFKTTATFREHGDPALWKDEWHTMPIKDCKGPV